MSEKKTDPSLQAQEEQKNKAQNCEVCQSKKASSYCNQCGVRFCSSCDRKNHNGFLDKHVRSPFIFKEENQPRPEVPKCAVHTDRFEDQWCKYCKIFVCDYCLQNPEHKNHFTEVSEQNEVSERHGRQLQEQVSLLKQKITDGALFLRSKIAFRFDKELQGLVNGRLKDEFEKLHMLLRQTQEALARDSLNWKDDMMPGIEQQIAELDRYFDISSKLITEGELALFQRPDYFQEGAKGKVLLNKLRDRNEFDVMGRVNALEKSVNFSDFSVYGGPSVNNSIRRIFIAPRSKTFEEDVSSRADRDDYLPVGEETFDKLDFTAIFELSRRKFLDRWQSQYDLSLEIDGEQEFRKLLKQLTEDDLLENHGAPHDYLHKLLGKRDVKFPKAFEKDVLEAILTVFENMVRKQEKVFNDLRARSHNERDETKLLSRDSLAGTWAAYMERQIDVGVRSMVVTKEQDAARRQWLSNMTSSSFGTH